MVKYGLLAIFRALEMSCAVVGIVRETCRRAQLEGSLDENSVGPRLRWSLPGTAWFQLALFSGGANRCSKAITNPQVGLQKACLF